MSELTHGYDPVVRMLEIRMNIIERSLRKQSKQVSWVVAIIIALIINIFLIPLMKQQGDKYPLINEKYSQLREKEKKLAIDVSLAWSDWYHGVDRTPAPLTGNMAIIGMNRKEAAVFAYNVRDTECKQKGRHNYQAINQYGYLGCYQFGATALAQVGLVKRSAVKKASRGVRSGRSGQYQFLKNENNWTIKGGIKTFLADKSLQDSAFVNLTNFNIRYGYQVRVLGKHVGAAKHAGFAKAAHLKGGIAARNWYKYGKDSKDGNGTKVSTYARQAERAVSRATLFTVPDIQVKGYIGENAYTSLWDSIKKYIF